MFNVYSASAGAGKTYNLVLDYLKQCFSQHQNRFESLKDKMSFVCESCPAYRSILAITFTNNAGAEMKKRIVGKLNELAFAKSVDELGIGDFENLCRKCFGDNCFKKLPYTRDEYFVFFSRCSRALLHDILYDYARFSVSTIDSFIQRIIRSSALYLGLNMSYAVQIHLDEFYKNTISQYISALPDNIGQLNTAIRELSRQMENNGKASLKKFLENSLDIVYASPEKSHDFVKNSPDFDKIVRIVEQWHREYQSVLEDYKNVLPNEMSNISNKAADVFARAANAGITPCGRSKWDEFFRELASNESYWLNLRDKGYSSGKFNKKSKPDKVFNTSKNSDLYDRLTGEIIDLYNGAKDIIDDYARRYYTYSILLSNSNKLLVLSALRERMEILKAQTNTFFLSESNPLIFDEIRSFSEGLPLFENVKFYKHFFLDEFQDTSRMQWEDLKPLLINSLGSGDGSVTLFGDVKQSIYRFRNGDVKLLYNLMDYSRMTANDRNIANVVPKQDFNMVPLSKNWRSLPNIVSFNNDFFHFYADRVGKNDYYSDVKQEFSDKKSGGLVVAYPYNSSSERLDIGSVWLTGDADYISNIYPKLNLQTSYILHSIVDALNRGYDYGDIMLLLSGNDKCSEMAATLMTAGIPVVTSESLSLADNQAVDLTINTLELFLNPTDSLRQNVIIKHFASKSKSGYISSLTSFDSFDKKMELFGKKDFLNEIKSILRNPFVFAIKDLIAYYEFSDKENPFIADFLDIVSDYSQKYIASIGHFLQWWYDLVRSNSVPKLALPEGHNAVRVMTVHKSKGLEAPVVITYCNDQSPKPEELVWLSKDGVSCPAEMSKNMSYSEFSTKYEQEKEDIVLDKLNKWYVDFTRARDILYIVAPQADKGDAALIQNMLKQFFKDKFQNVSDGFRLFFGDFNQNNAKKGSKKESVGEKLGISFSGITFYNNDKIRIPLTADDDARVLGTEVHSVLQQLNSFPKTDDEIEDVVNAQPLSVRKILHSVFRQIIENGEMHPYFFPDSDDKIKNEAEIITDDGSVRRPDRIVFKKDHVMVIDYKTGKEHDLIYQKQLEKYKISLEKMGYKDVRTKILYLKMA